MKTRLLPIGTQVKAEIDGASFSLDSNEITGRIVAYDPNSNYWVMLKNSEMVLVYEEQIVELL